MTEQKNKKRPVLENAIPVLSADDLEEAITYYREVLGFDVGWSWGNPPTMVGLRRDRIEIHLAKRGTAGPHGPSTVYVRVRGIDDYYADCIWRGAQVSSEIANQEYGMRDFAVTDPAGNNLCFGESTES